MIKIKLWSAPTSTKINMKVLEQTAYKNFLGKKIEIVSQLYPELRIQNGNLVFLRGENTEDDNIIVQEMFRSKHEAISAMQELHCVINEINEELI